MPVLDPIASRACGAGLMLLCEQGFRPCSHNNIYL